MLASFPARIVNHLFADSGIPFRFRLSWMRSSETHLDVARDRFKRKNINNTELTRLMDLLHAPREFDILYSILVLQHNPPPVMYWLLDSFLSNLNPDGYAFFQVPCYLDNYDFDAGAYLAGDGRLNSMEMHALPQNYVFKLLAKHGMTPIELLPNPRIGPIGFSFSFLAGKASRPQPIR